MRLRLTINLGHADAGRLGLGSARDGQFVEAGPEAADELLARGWAVEAAPSPAAIRAVPPAGIEAADGSEHTSDPGGDEARDVGDEADDETPDDETPDDETPDEPPSGRAPSRRHGRNHRTR